MKAFQRLAPGLMLIAVCAGFAAAQPNMTDEDAVSLISQIKRTSASQLDPTLPPIALQKWLRLQLGKEVTIAWVVGRREEVGHGYPFAEACISTVDAAGEHHPQLSIRVSCGSYVDGICGKPRFRFIALAREGEDVEWDHLRELPAAMQRASSDGR
jgi:hypothetical protein